MRTRSVPTKLYLDFDGVLCDSLEECYRSSWLTREGVEIGPQPVPEPPFDAAYRARFDACRPFIRSGEDYIVVHEWAARGSVPQVQSEFDATLSEKGQAVMAGWKEKLYAVRDRLLEHHRGAWLGWNPLYRGIAAALLSQVDNPDVVILSTKKAEFIVEILGHHGVPWPLSRTVYTGPRRKLDLIEELTPGEPSVLIDDQVDHLDFDHPSCRCTLALWGYIAPGAAATVPDGITLDQALGLITDFPRRRHPAG